jgi:hypothetical protein
VDQPQVQPPRGRHHRQHVLAPAPDRHRLEDLVGGHAQLSGLLERGEGAPVGDDLERHPALGQILRHQRHLASSSADRRPEIPTDHPQHPPSRPGPQDPGPRAARAVGRPAWLSRPAARPGPPVGGQPGGAASRMRLPGRQPGRHPRGGVAMAAELGVEPAGSCWPGVGRRPSGAAGRPRARRPGRLRQRPRSGQVWGTRGRWRGGGAHRRSPRPVVSTFSPAERTIATTRSM